MSDLFVPGCIVTTIVWFSLNLLMDVGFTERQLQVLQSKCASNDGVSKVISNSFGERKRVVCINGATFTLEK